MNFSYCLIFSLILFFIGLIGIFINRKNLLMLLMCIELILLSVNTNFVIFAKFWNDLTGQIFVFFIISIAASEVVIGLAIFILFFRKVKNIKTENLNLLKG